MGDVKLNNAVDGFGRINRYDIKNGTITFTSKLLDSTWKDTCEKHNDIEPLVLFMETEPPRWKSKIPGMNMKGNSDFPDNLFVQIGVQPDKTTFWASSDVPAPLKIDPINLTQEKLLKWDDNLECLLGVTHPRMHPDGYMVSICSMMSMDGKGFIRVYKIDPDEPLKR